MYRKFLQSESMLLASQVSDQFQILAKYSQFASCRRSPEELLNFLQFEDTEKLTGYSSSSYLYAEQRFLQIQNLKSFRSCLSSTLPADLITLHGAIWHSFTCYVLRRTKINSQCSSKRPDWQ